MKRFLIFSDNHGINIYLKEVLDQIGTDFDGVVQLGDCQNARDRTRDPMTALPARFIWCVVIVMV